MILCFFSVSILHTLVWVSFRVWFRWCMHDFYFVSFLLWIVSGWFTFSILSFTNLFLWALELFFTSSVSIHDRERPQGNKNWEDIGVSGPGGMGFYLSLHVYSDLSIQVHYVLTLKVLVNWLCLYLLSSAASYVAFILLQPTRAPTTYFCRKCRNVDPTPQMGLLACAWPPCCKKCRYGYLT